MSPEQAALKQGSRTLAEGCHQIRLTLDNLHCGACVAKVERALQTQPHIQHARVNLTTRSVLIRWCGDVPPTLLSQLASLGFPARVSNDGRSGTDDQLDARATLNSLLVALGVSGFAAMNIMLLSVSVWSGADPATAHLFHVISAVIAVPAIAFSAQHFLKRAWQVLRHGSTNMDVPISIGILLATGASLYDTFIGDGPVYFEASLMLVFFLLIGRTLDFLSREKARRTVDDLARLQPDAAIVIDAAGVEHYRAVADVSCGDRLRVGAHDRFPCDGVVEQGRSEVDMSLITGEGLPQLVAPGSHVSAGTLNLLDRVTLQVTASADESFLGRTRALMLNADAGRGRYRRIADRASRLYAPVVHVAAAAGFLSWYMATGDAHQAVGIAVAVLIITCPCALGLAVPMAQVVVSRRLFQSGILIKDGAALERLEQVDTIVFDKTGTLTGDVPMLEHTERIDTQALNMASLLAYTSSHPHALSLLEERQRRSSPRDAASERLHTTRVRDRQELPGLGIQAVIDGKRWRLGKPEWALSSNLSVVPEGDVDDLALDDTVGVAYDDAGIETATGNAAIPTRGPGTVLSCENRLVARFHFREAPKLDAERVVSLLADRGYRLHVLSGDKESAVAGLSQRLGIDHYLANVLPEEKWSHLQGLQQQGRCVLMIGDGINDAPAMVAADVSMAPGSAADVGRSAADIIYLRGSLLAVPEVLMLANRTARIVRQNFSIALIYNLVALPLALAGFVTPLLAAVAMSSSSVLVVANALRLGARSRRGAAMASDRRRVNASRRAAVTQP